MGNFDWKWIEWDREREEIQIKDGKGRQRRDSGKKRVRTRVPRKVVTVPVISTGCCAERANLSTFRGTLILLSLFALFVLFLLDHPVPVYSKPRWSI